MSTSPKPGARSWPRQWRMPILLAVLTTAGLLFGLFGDGVWDALSWLALLVPLGVICRCTLRRSK